MLMPTLQIAQPGLFYESRHDHLAFHLLIIAAAIEIKKKKSFQYLMHIVKGIRLVPRCNTDLEKSCEAQSQSREAGVEARDSIFQSRGGGIRRVVPMPSDE